MKFKCILPFLLALSCSISHAQDFLGYMNSNYAGVHGLALQPACIVDSRFMVDIGIFGVNGTVLNNYIGIKRSYFRSYDFENETLTFDELKTKWMYEEVNSEDKIVLASAHAILPSIMISLNEKNSLAFSARIRTKVNVSGLGPELAKLMYEELDYPLLWNQFFSNEKLSIQGLSWAEYGVSYGREVKDWGKHYLKAGATVKLLQGLGAAYMYSDRLEYNFHDEETLSINNSDVQYGHSENFEFEEDEVKYKFIANPSFGFDLGAVYEWRPKYKEFKYDMDGETGLWRNDLNKYKFKAGVSILDLGRMKFDKGDISGDFTADLDHYDISNFSVNSIEEFNDSIEKLFGFDPDDDGEFKMDLPTALSFQFDYNIWKDFYVNFTSFIGFKRKNDPTKVYESTVLSLTPRYDYKWFGFGIPFSVNFDQGNNIGFDLRLGPLVFGTNDFVGWARDKVFAANFYAALKIPVPYGKPKDKDLDKVSNRKDECKTDPGPWETRGCPDSDADGLLDKDDDCPKVPGPEDNKGCPYPDTDKDGVLDTVDRCIDIPGPAENHGCPYPDTDGDTVLDKDDACVDIRGPVDNKGCPYPDTDGDGVLDRNDECPQTPGLAENKGCPKLEQKEEKVIQTAFENLEFENGKAVIRFDSYQTLEQLGLLLVNKPELKLTVAGHTDNVGSEGDNLNLSKQRAEAVKTFLVDSGVAASRIKVEYFGESKPIADNATSKGRALNRRVELTVKFD